MAVTFAIPSRPLIVVSIFIFSAIFFLWDQGSGQGYSSRINTLSKSPPTNGKKYAYTAFLAAPWDVPENATDDDDKYFTQTRMLLWQLKHDPATRSPNNYPFVILVTEDVSESKRERLRREGADVREVEKLRPLQHETRKAWADVLTKLRLFEMVEFDRLAFFDSDTILTKPTDGMFEDAAVRPQKNKNLKKKDAVKDDEGPQPQTYVFASNCGSGGYDHKLPPPQGNNLNAGILVFQPSIELFNYHVSLTAPEVEGRFNGRYPEQGLWSYAHRRDGNMPWKQLDWKWNINWAAYGDVEAGIASLHAKYWELEHDTKLRDFAMRIKWRMEGFWEAVDAAEGR